jgi:DNA replicative helicase MCM subunit Mcm2 (Cdc46/Mcm family)
LGEKVEIVGNLYVVPSSSLYTRRGNSGSNNGKYYSILYADKLKYENREEDIKLDPNDISAIKKFKSFPDLTDRLISMFAPNIYGHSSVKLGILLLAVGSPKTTSYKRNWINAGLFGDHGTAKTMIGDEAVNLVPKSQTVSGQHSTGKGVVAIAEKESDNSAVLRLGAAALANNAVCFIDEIGTMQLEDQEQLLTIMEKGYIHFNKYGIRQKIVSKTSLIVSSNTQTTNWRSPHKITKDELPLKLTLIDRLDLIFGFREPTSEVEIRDYANNMLELSKKHFKLDYSILKKYLHYARTYCNPVDFEDDDIPKKLTDLYVN